MSKKSKTPKKWQFDESCNAGVELRDFALNIIATDEKPVIKLTISDFLRTLRGLSQGIALLLADNFLTDEEGKQFRQSARLLEVLADSDERMRDIFTNDDEDECDI